MHGLGVDLLLTDVVMPEVSGQALAGADRGGAPDVRILFMSGYSDGAVHRHGMVPERSAFIEKPFTERALTIKVREVLGAPKEGQSLFRLLGAAGAGRG